LRTYSATFTASVAKWILWGFLNGFLVFTSLGKSLCPWSQFTWISWVLHQTWWKVYFSKPAIQIHWWPHIGPRFLSKSAPLMDADDSPAQTCRMQAYQSLIGSIGWLAMTPCPDLTSINSFLSLYNAKLLDGHMKSALYVLHYIHSTYNYGISFTSKDMVLMHSYIHYPPSTDVEAYTDAIPPKLLTTVPSWLIVMHVGDRRSAMLLQKVPSSPSSSSGVWMVASFSKTAVPSDGLANIRNACLSALLRLKFGLSMQCQRRYGLPQSLSQWHNRWPLLSDGIVQWQWCMCQTVLQYDLKSGLSHWAPWEFHSGMGPGQDSEYCPCCWENQPRQYLHKGDEGLCPFLLPQRLFHDSPFWLCEGLCRIIPYYCKGDFYLNVSTITKEHFQMKLV
jgi:hypothetical protein